MERMEVDKRRILSDEGILLRINRSIQAEGSFGELKHDMQFRRYLSRGTSNVLAESILLAMAKNVNKLHNKIQKSFQIQFWIALKYGFFTKKLSFQ